MVTEARLERVASGVAPVTPGWFVVNTADAAWTNNDAYGGVCIFESDEFVLQGRPDLTAYEKPHAGFTIRVVPPGKPATLYHAESVQEDFLVLMGECVLIIEDEERHLRPWDFVHCPPDDRAHVHRDGRRAVRARSHRKPARRSRARVPSIGGRPPLRRELRERHGRA